MTPTTTSLYTRKRVWNGLGFLGVCLLLMSAYYMEYVEGMQPCLLCVIQRFMLWGMGFVFLVAWLHHSKNIAVSRLYALVLMILALLGILAASRQLWLQAQPETSVASCIPDLTFLLKHMPFTQTMQLILNEGNQCREVGVTLFGLSLPFWTLIAFVVLGGLGIMQGIKIRPPE